MIQRKEFATWLDGINVNDGISLDNQSTAIDSGLLVIIGESDDTLAFYGTVSCKIVATGGIVVWLTPSGRIEDDPSMGAIRIVAEWNPGDFGAAWRVSADVSYSEFRINDPDSIFCFGCVIDFKPTGE
jgi:hypothetical protein